MAQFETWYKQDLKKPLVVHRHADVFNQDSRGNLIGVEVYSDGEPVSLSGSIDGYCLLSDGTTVSAVGANRAGNKASILIPQTAYNVPGPITITIKNTDGNDITTLCAVVGLVRQSVSGNLVQPGDIVTDWSQSINSQLQAVQDAADNVGAIVAAPFAENTAYVVGNYVTYNGNLYRITADHAAGVTWANTAKTQCTVGNELFNLNGAMRYNRDNLVKVPYVFANVTEKGFTYTINDDGSITVTGTATSSSYYEKVLFEGKLKAGVYTLSGGTSLHCLRIFYKQTESGNYSGNYETSANGSVTFTFNTDMYVSVRIRRRNSGTISGGEETVYPMLESGSAVNEFVSPILSRDYLLNRNPGLNIYNLVRWPYLDSARDNDYFDITYNENGSVLISGENTTDATVGIYINKESYYAVLQPGIYTLSGSSANVWLQAHYRTHGSSDSWSSVTCSGAGGKCVFNLTSVSDVRLSLKVSANTAVNNETVYPQLERGNIAHDFTQPKYANENIEERVAQIEGSETYIYSGQATSILSQSTRTIEMYDESTSQYVNIDVTSYWTDELNKTGVYNIKTVESKTIYDLPDSAKGMVSQIAVTTLSDRCFQVLTCKAGIWWRSVNTPVSAQYHNWIKLSSSENDAETLPDHWNDYISAKIPIWQSYLDKTGLTGDAFIFFTDYHYKYNAQNSAKLMRVIMQACGISKILFGGDLINHFSASATSDVLDDLTNALNTLSPVIDNIYGIAGNHEHHTNSQTQYDPGDSIIYSLLAKRHEQEFGWVDAYGNYWFDNPVRKIRYFMIGCNVNAHINELAVEGINDQLDAVPSGYTIVVVTHYAIDFSGGSAVIFNDEPLTKILTKLNEIATASNGVSVACVLSGHRHRDADITTYPFPVIATITDAYAKVSSALPPGTMVLGTTTEQAFDIVYVDTNPQNRKVYLQRVGAGSDRVFSY